MMATQNYAMIDDIWTPVLTLRLRNYNGKETQIEVILDSGFEGDLHIRQGIFEKLELNMWGMEKSAWPFSSRRVAYAEICILGFNRYWRVEVETRGLNENLLGLGVLNKMCATFNALTNPKQTTLEIEKKE